MLVVSDYCSGKVFIYLNKNFKKIETAENFIIKEGFKLSQVEFIFGKNLEVNYI